MSELPKSSEESGQHLLPRDLLHDLRTPLGHILGYSELMIEQMRARGDEEFIPYLEKVRGAALTLLKIMKDNFQELHPPDGGLGANSQMTEPIADPPSSSG